MDKKNNKQTTPSVLNRIEWATMQFYKIKSYG